MMRYGGALFILPDMMIWQRWAQFFRGAPTTPTRAQLHDLECLNRLILRACVLNPELSPTAVAGSPRTESDESAPKQSERDAREHRWKQLDAS